MNNFLKGVLFGAGVGLLIAPMRGQEMRNLLTQRFNELRGSLPESDQLNQYTQQVTNRVSQSANNLKGYAQQAASTVRNSASNLTSIAQNAATTVKQTTQDVTDTTKQAAKPVVQNTVDTAKQTAQNAVDTAKQTAQNTADTAKQSAASEKPKTTTTGTTDTAPFPSAYPDYVNPETNPKR